MKGERIKRARPAARKSASEKERGERDRETEIEIWECRGKG